MEWRGNNTILGSWNYTLCLLSKEKSPAVGEGLPTMDFRVFEWKKYEWLDSSGVARPTVQDENAWRDFSELAYFSTLTTLKNIREKFPRIQELRKTEKLVQNSKFFNHPGTLDFSTFSRAYYVFHNSLTRRGLPKIFSKDVKGVTFLSYEKFS